jgi:hypothetical protein
MDFFGQFFGSEKMQNFEEGDDREVIDFGNTRVFCGQRNEKKLYQ